MATASRTRAPAPWRRAVAAVVVLVVLAGGVVAALWAWQRRLIYFPDASPVAPAGEVVAGARDVTLRTEDGLTLTAWFLPSPASGARGYAVLMLPGNGGNRLGRAGLAEEVAERGFAVLVLDYRGYGGNPGAPTEDGLARDADAAVSALRALGYPPARTLYLGESLGTGVAAALSARTPPAGMLLRSPFTDLAAVGSRQYPWLPVGWLLQDRFPVLPHVRGSRVPLTVVYGDRDRVVPPELSREVARAAEAGGTLVEELVLDADHNDPVMFGPTIADALAELADAAER